MISDILLHLHPCLISKNRETSNIKKLPGMTGVGRVEKQGGSRRRGSGNNCRCVKMNKKIKKIKLKNKNNLIFYHLLKILCIRLINRLWWECIVLQYFMTNYFPSLGTFPVAKEPNITAMAINRTICVYAWIIMRELLKKCKPWTLEVRGS